MNRLKDNEASKLSIYNQNNHNDHIIKKFSF